MSTKDPTSSASFAQFGAAFVPALAICVVGLTAALLLRPYIRDVYDAKLERIDIAGTREKEDAPPERPLTVWGWALQLYRMTDEDIIRYCGADALMYLRFMRLGLKMSVITAIPALLILVPINVRGGLALHQFDRLSLSNVSPNSPMLWAHTLAMYLLTGLALRLLYSEYMAYVDLRQRYWSEPRAQSYSVLIRDLPLDVDRSVTETYLRTLLGPDLVALHLVPDHPGDVLSLTQSKDTTILQLERARQQLADSPQGTRPEHKPLCCGLRGEKVDSIDAYEAKIAELNDKLVKAQEQREKCERVVAAIATFSSIQAATAYRRVPVQRFVRFFSVDPAPAANDLIWKNLGCPKLFRQVRCLVVMFLVLMLIFCYTIPVAFVASLANLDKLAQINGLEWIGSINEYYPKLNTLLQGFVPPLVLSIFISLVPTIMIALSHLEAPTSDSDAQTRAIEKVYLFVLLDVFLAYTVTGTSFSKINMMLGYASKPMEIMNLLAQALPQQATFFMSLIAVAALSGQAMEALLIGPLFMVKLKRKFLAATKWGHLTAMVQVTTFPDLYNYPLLVFMATVAYAPLAPLMLLVSTLYFAMAYVVQLNQLVYVYNIPFHTGGSQWPVVFNTSVSSLVMAQVLMAGVLALKGMATPSLLMLPLIFGTVTFARGLSRALEPISNVLTLENLVEVGQDEVPESAVKQLQQAYDLGSLHSSGQELSAPYRQPLEQPFGIKNDGLLNELAEIQDERRAAGAVQDEEMGQSGAPLLRTPTSANLAQSIQMQAVAGMHQPGQPLPLTPTAATQKPAQQ